MDSLGPSGLKSVLITDCQDEIKSYASIVCLRFFNFRALV
jgi:phosphoribosyl 1,2-cyclic phosphate phosphodiesterase